MLEAARRLMIRDEGEAKQQLKQERRQSVETREVPDLKVFARCWATTSYATRLILSGEYTNDEAAPLMQISRRVAKFRLVNLYQGSIKRQR